MSEEDARERSQESPMSVSISSLGHRHAWEIEYTQPRVFPAKAVAWLWHRAAE